MCAKKFQISSHTWAIWPGCTYMQTKIRSHDDHRSRRHIGSLVLVLGLATAALVGRIALSPSQTGRTGPHTGARAARPAPVPSVPLIRAPGAADPRTQPSAARAGSQGKRALGGISIPTRSPKSSLTSLSPPPLPGAAINVAAAYAIATYGWIAGETFGQWIGLVTPLVTAQWLNRLSSADPTTSSVSTSVRVEAVIPAHGAGGQLRADVVVTLDPGGGRALLVTLVPTTSGWAVDGAS
jgi:hypothetical protein